MRRASSVPRRRAAVPWDSSKSDLSVHRATPPDIERRKAKTRSHNANLARAELDERQQRMSVGDFSHIYEGLEATNPSDRNRPLDYESPRTAERPRHSDASMHSDASVENVSSHPSTPLASCLRQPGPALLCVTLGARSARRPRPAVSKWSYSTGRALRVRGCTDAAT